MRCTEVADRPFPDSEFFGRDIGDRGRSILRPDNAARLDSVSTWRI